MTGSPDELVLRARARIGESPIGRGMVGTAGEAGSSPRASPIGSPFRPLVQGLGMPADSGGSLPPLGGGLVVLRPPCTTQVQSARYQCGQSFQTTSLRPRHCHLVPDANAGSIPHSATKYQGLRDLSGPFFLPVPRGKAGPASGLLRAPCRRIQPFSATRVSLFSAWLRTVLRRHLGFMRVSGR